MRRPILMTLLLAMAAAPACATPNTPTGSQTAAQKASAERAEVEALLRGYHGLPERARFEAAAVDPAKVLRAVAADPYAGPMRTAALEALKWWPDAQTLALYTEALRADQPAGVRHKVLRYVVVFGEAAVPLLADALRDGDVQIRRTAATALFELPGEKATEALAAATVKEPDPTLAAELRDFVSRRGSVR